MSEEQFFIAEGGNLLLNRLTEAIVSARPTSLSIASAFVTFGGVYELDQLAQKASIRDVRLVAGTDFCITQPEALRDSIDKGWNLRIAQPRNGIFHPKVIIASSEKEGTLEPNGILYVGSANLTGRGLRENIESCWMGNRNIEQPIIEFNRIWETSREFSEEFFEDYSKLFAKANASRSAETRDALQGVLSSTSGEEKRTVISHTYATAAWAELKSFTGGYVLQVEFPRDVAEVVRGFVHGRLSNDDRVQINCADGDIRNLMLKFYEANSMYRLNIPKSVPNVKSAIETHSGIALLTNLGPQEPLQLKIVTMPDEMETIVSRSEALHSIYTTTTRRYGWY